VSYPIQRLAAILIFITPALQALSIVMLTLTLIGVLK
jgi:hypothetical protein